MKNFLLIFIVAIISACSTPKQTETNFYIGTYTNHQSKGIYQAKLTNKGTIKDIKLVAETKNPSFLTFSSDRKNLLAVNELHLKDTGGFVSNYLIKKDTLILKDKSLSGGDDPCYINILSGNYVATANYSSGTIGLLKLDKNNRLSTLLDVEKHEGKGTTDRQKSAHVHFVQALNHSDTLLSVDLGTNEIWVSTVNSDSNNLVSIPEMNLKLPDAAGPRHFCFSPTQSKIYVLSELNSTVTTINILSNNKMSLSKSVSTLPPEYKGENSGAEIAISSDGKFVYASNRGHNSLSVFSVDKEGELQMIQNVDCKGNWPRNFALSPNENFILVANKKSNNITVFKREKKEGTLKFISETKTPEPVCILF